MDIQLKREVIHMGSLRFQTITLIFIGALLVLLGVVIGWFGGKGEEFSFSLQSNSAAKSESIPQFSSFEDASRYFRQLAQDKGAEYAFDVLRTFEASGAIDMHLLGHVVGDALYKQKGLEGIKSCTEDFRNACSHSIVVGSFLEKGEETLGAIAEICRLAPGGKGAYGMCFHGLGHGILAYTGYNLEKAAEICGKTGSEQNRSGEPTECIGGAIMEMISGGFHNQPLWQEQRKKYFTSEDPFSPCNRDFIPEEARSICYIYLTPWFWETVGADMRSPTAVDFQRAFKLCDQLPFEYRDACYGGFGKEFVVLAKGRDIRIITRENTSDAQLASIYQWCIFAQNKTGISNCLMTALNSLYWMGSNDRKVSIRFCEILRDEFYRSPCFSNLISLVAFYLQDPSYRKEFCEEVPREYKEQCVHGLS